MGSLISLILLIVIICFAIGFIIGLTIFEFEPMGIVGCCTIAIVIGILIGTSIFRNYDEEKESVCTSFEDCIMNPKYDHEWKIIDTKISKLELEDGCTTYYVVYCPTCGGELNVSEKLYNKWEAYMEKWGPYRDNK